MKRYDVAFVGLGAAAMSLSARLALSHFNGNVVFIEPNSSLGKECTWCGWGPSQHPFTAQITRQWTHWAVSHGADAVHSGHPEMPYEMLRSSTVRDAALNLISQRDDWQMHLGRRLHGAKKNADAWLLTLDNDEQIMAQWVFDARPPQLSLKRPWVWQSFVGLELYNHDFGPENTVRLMDFIDDEEPLATFIYELPIANDRRLIELTRFTPEPADLSSLRDRLQRIIQARGWQTARIEREESGQLPMAPIPTYSKDSWLRIGTAGGSMRPATGYAFHTIQLWADQCAAAMVAGKPPVPPRRSKVMDWLDGVFLESLWQEPHNSGHQFVRLFRRTPPESLVRFLMSRPTSRDTLRIFRALPFAHMLKAAWHHSWRIG